MAESTAIERLQMSVVDGRTENGRYRQYQLQALHKSLREEAGDICSALLADSRSPSAEVETEYYLAMNAVRHFYDSLDFEGELKEEYSVVHGKDNLSRRVGVGMVVIKPTSHTRFYSIVTPLAAAIAAGNCIILELPDNVRRVDAVLRALLTKALDGNTFHVSKSVTDRSILEDAVVVDQNSTVTSKISPSHLTSPTNARCVAVVDRSANVDEAAKAITVARFSFGGQSPYAPDLVLVNEFVKTKFFEACSRYATLAFAKESSVKNVNVGANDDVKQAIKDAESKRQVSSFGSNDFKLVDILDKSSPIMYMKVTGRYLPIATCSSLTDAVYNYEYEKPLLAGYFFAEPSSAKYLAQFIPSHVSLINQIPVHLLVGPAAPTAHEPDFHYRYSKDMFSVPRPQFVERPPDVFRKVEELLYGTSKEVTVSTLRDSAAKPLPPTKQSDNNGVGFFEQGIITGVSIMASIIIPAVGYSTYFLGRKGVEYVMKLRR
ncbi:Aldehyde dehydrogenase, dimeric NADP-preferring [Cytospora mali]|uniref:Aldehyde dehydrogenase, dimeric NADP-preferring n=1 Tax=Cytospora mali TaxID=578113 RepID=A0A194W4X2_CYTMA|nr:Aldehyde dehydrogenase, dimeric NADP-preferring [Valsa mali]